MSETKDILKVVKKIEISTRELVEGLITGNYHSVFKGQGIEFSEIRDYRPGDDVRAIDWKVTARFNYPYIKEFIEERDLRVYFAFDVSGSGSFGDKVSKRRRAVEIAASLMFASLRNNDNIGLFLFSDGIEKFIPARKGRKHVLKLITTLVTYQPESKHTNIAESLKFISKVIKKKSIIFVVSDFISNVFADDFSVPLKHLKNRHDVIAMRIIDPREREIPDVGLIELEDEETGEQILVDTSDEEFRHNYSSLIAEQDAKLRSRFNKIKVDFLDVLTDEPYAVPLKKFFRIRQRRVVY